MMALFEHYDDPIAREGLVDILTYTVLLPSLEWHFSENTPVVARW
jgi:hypothetical protein